MQYFDWNSLSKTNRISLRHLSRLTLQQYIVFFCKSLTQRRPYINVSWSFQVLHYPLGGWGEGDVQFSTTGDHQKKASAVCPRTSIRAFLIVVWHIRKKSLLCCVVEILHKEWAFLVANGCGLSIDSVWRSFGDFQLFFACSNIAFWSNIFKTILSSTALFRIVFGVMQCREADIPKRSVFGYMHTHTRTHTHIHMHTHMYT